MDDRKFNQLIEAYQQNALTGEVKDLMDQWYASFDDNPERPVWSESELEALKEQILAAVSSADRTPRLRYIARIAVAAVLLVAVGFTVHHFFFGRAIHRNNEEVVDVAPGGNKATLTLADGRQVILDDRITGIKVEANGIAYDDGSLVIDQATLPRNEIGIYTLSTPRGGQYKIRLPDGTHVWLNAESTLHYPAAFSENERIVELEGEAYFEVKQQSDGSKRMPFLVKTHGQTVEVLGTEFNISAYPDEQTIRTTLLTGKVRLESPIGQTTELLPNQQSVIERAGTGTFKIRAIDPSVEIAWTSNMFIFHNLNMHEMMRRIQRWYDVEIAFDALPDETFYGEISRDVPLSEVLKLIEMTSDYKFTIKAGENQERRVIMQ